MTIRSVSENAIAVFCGSSSGNHPAYIRAAQSLGKSLAIANRRLVYGGGEQGLMGAVFQATLTAGGKVTAINLRTFMEQGGEREKVPENTICGARETGYGMFVPPASCQVETVVVESLQDRKLAMAKRCRGFIGLPGGFGTYDEVFEVATWTQIGLQNRRFYDPLKQQIENAIEAGFVESFNQSLVIFVDGPNDKQQHETFNWGQAAFAAVDRWYEQRKDVPRPRFVWESRLRV